MGLKLANNAISVLASGITTGATTITLAAGTGSRFPSLGAGDYHPATISKPDGTFEIVKVTARSGDTLTVTRAQEGTAALSFAAGSIVEVRLTVQTLYDLLNDVAPAQVSDKVNTSTGAFYSPAGTTAQRPINPTNGLTRYNTTTGTWEAYNNGGWNPQNTSVVTNYQQFTTSGTFTVPAGVRFIQLLIVGGGGGGGTVGGGGGGGGGVLFIENYPVTPGANIPVAVGAGGSPASNGGYSQFDGHHIAWGGGGGPALTDTSFGSPSGPKLGASGGGAGATSTVIGTPAPGSAQGSAGGMAPLAGPYPAGGGGGAGSVGGNGYGSTNGSGGTGVYSQMFSAYGESGWFGGGGGGGYTGNTLGAGGLGGGGSGAVAGLANTGGGGGGVYTAGTNGGSGTVIVAWYQ